MRSIEIHDLMAAEYPIIYQVCFKVHYVPQIFFFRNIKE